MKDINDIRRVAATSALSVLLLAGCDVGAGSTTNRYASSPRQISRKEREIRKAKKKAANQSRKRNKK